MGNTLLPLGISHCGIEWRNPSRLRPGLTPKINIFFQLLLQDKIHTLDNLAKRGQIIPNRCSLCKHDLEMINHLFIHFPYSSKVWNLLTRDFGVSWCPLANIQDFFSQWKSSHLDLITQLIWSWSLLHFCWEIWKERNNQIFRDRRVCRFLDIHAEYCRVIVYYQINELKF